MGEKMTYVLNATYSHIDDVPGVGFADWYGAANYFIYNLSDNLTSRPGSSCSTTSRGSAPGPKGCTPG